MKLQRITSAIYTCTNAEQCLSYIDNIDDKKVFIIVSDDLGEEIVPLIHDKPQLDSIYIFSQVKRQRLPWANKWSEKIKQILFDMEDIFQNIKFDSGLVGSLTSISIIRRIDIPSLIGNELDQSYMYTQLLKEILLEMKHDHISKNKLVEFCREKYIDNILQLSLIDEFDQEYDNNLAIQWYTKESFLYATLNRALREQDIETIMKMGFFLHDLHQQILDMHNEQSKTRDHNKFIVYRGQGMTPGEIEKIQASQGGLLSFNNFLSTTLDEKVSFHFAEKAYKNPNVIAVLFHMEINPKISSVQFAFIDKQSTYKYESEILFSMHTVFRIMGSQKLEDRFWQVNLALTSDNDEQLRNIADYMRKELGKGTSLDKLGHLMLKMGELSQAEEIYAPQLDSTDEKNWRRHSHLNHQLGCVYSEKGDYKTAILYYEKALKGELDFLPSDDPSLAPTYNNIAGVHESLGDYGSALSSYQKALEIEEKSLPPDHPTLATTYSNIGLMHKTLADFASALSFYQKSLEIRQKTLPSNHPDFGAIYSNIGALHQDMGDYSTALKFYQQALDVREKYLPPKHRDLATSYGNFGSIHSSMGDKSKALEYYQKALEIRELSLPTNHPDKANSYICIGSVYDSMDNYSSALSCFEKALEIQKLTFPENHSDFADTYSSFDSAYSSMRDKLTALSYYQKALEIRELSLPPKHPNVATCYNNLGTIYSSMGNKQKALSSYEKSLKIKQACLPPNYPSLVITYNNIGLVYQSMSDYSTALSFYQKACEICEKNPQLSQLNEAATTYNKIGSVHHSMEEYSIALSFCEKALEIQSKSPNPKNRSLAITYSNIGLAYHEMKDHQKALTFYEKAFEIEQKALPDDHRDLATSYTNIGLVYDAMKDYTTALSYHEKALII
ncbi:unnamed protein product [Rotaria sp. Silwood2]|nr:unnamed protein product [Rotaria sp. Silwood2]